MFCFKNINAMAEKDHIEKEETIDKNDPVENSVEVDENKIETLGEESTAEVELTENEKLKKENAELKDKYLRLYSEFENYRRRTAKERLELIKTASEDVITDLVSVVDDFERSLNVEGGDVESIREGNLLIYNKWYNAIESKGLKSMGELIGTPFDAETQEAITMAPAPSEEMKGKVIDVIQKGYLLGDKVIKYAKVVIGA